MMSPLMVGYVVGKEYLPRPFAVQGAPSCLLLSSYEDHSEKEEMKNKRISYKIKLQLDKMILAKDLVVYL